MGRAARNVSGKVIMYADEVTDSMRVAIDETRRRRAIQQAYNEEHGIEPRSVQKAMSDISSFIASAAGDEDGEQPVAEEVARELAALPKDEVARIMEAIEEDMAAASERLDFEEAARLRDQLVRLKAQLEGGDEAEVMERLKKGARKSAGFGATGTSKRFNKHAKH
jgi:excinuclease ABC subunit B